MNFIQRTIYKWQHRDEFYCNPEPDYEKTHRIFIREAKRLGIIKDSMESKASEN